jgi:cytochrome c biogenesis protein CcmG, thiol:disulfide interchange protein DsbE
MRFRITIFLLLLSQFSFGHTKTDSLIPGTNYYAETSRPEDKINKTFPFDIDLHTPEGIKINTAQLLAQNNNKPTILLFWLTTCYPCLIEMQAIKEKLPEWNKQAQFRILAISTDFEDNYPKFVDRVKKEQFPFEAYHDFNREFRYVLPGGLNGLPQIFILDKTGKIVFHKKGYRPGEEQALIDFITTLR